MRSLVIFCVVFGVAGPNAGAESKNARVGDLLADVRRAVAESGSRPINLQIQITLKPGAEQAFERAFRPVIRATRAESGNLEFQLNRHPTEPYVYFLYERWKSLDAVERHMGTAHMKAFWPKYFPMLARAPVITTYLVDDLGN